MALTNGPSVTATRSLSGEKPFVKPCLRWAGGKRRHLQSILSLMPKSFGMYYEPMLGGGAVFLGIRPASAVLGDSNEELMHFYRMLRDKPSSLLSDLGTVVASRERYLELRKEKPSGDLRRAVRFAYLNRLCWNGLYRVNTRGEFNVPFGNRTPATMWDFDNMLRISEMLSRANLVHGDFEENLSGVGKSDFVFLDPPYPRGSSNGLGFNRYTSMHFRIEDHQRIASLAIDLDRSSAKVMICETSDPKIISLFPSSFEKATLTSSSLMAALPSARREVFEVILTNYVPNGPVGDRSKDG